MSTPPSHLSTNDADADTKRWTHVQECKGFTLENDPKIGRPTRNEQEIKELEQDLWDRELLSESMTKRTKEKENQAAQTANDSGTESREPKVTGDGTVLQRRDHKANPVNPMKRTMG